MKDYLRMFTELHIHRWHLIEELTVMTDIDHFQWSIMHSGVSTLSLSLLFDSILKNSKQTVLLMQPLLISSQRLVPRGGHGSQCAGTSGKSGCTVSG